jgi:hypothetical protein
MSWLSLHFSRVPICSSGHQFKLLSVGFLVLHMGIGFEASSLQWLNLLREVLNKKVLRGWPE